MIGYEVVTAADGEEALATFDEADPDLVVLDVMMPKLDGYGVCQELRKESDVPIIMLTALGDVADRITGLELGADDYLAKPFDPRELTARVRAILRRMSSASDSPASDTSLIAGRLTLDLKRRRVSIDNDLLELTGAEFRILQLLVEELGQPVERKVLTERALGRKLTLYDRSIDTHVSNLRRKLGRSGDCRIEIRSVRGTGYELIDLDTHE